MIDFFAVFLIAILSGMGVGSGGLLVIYLTVTRQISQLDAQGLNLLFFLFSSGAAFAFNLLYRKIYVLPDLILIAFALPGTLLGSFLAHRVDPALVRLAFGVMLVLSGTIVLFRPSPQKKKSKKE